MSTTHTSSSALDGLGFFEWLELVKSVPMSKPSTKLVAMTLGSYATYATGENARPGVANLVAATGTSKSTVLRALAELDRLGLIEQTARGQSRGRNGGGYASVYRLTAPQDLPSRLAAIGLAYEIEASAEHPDSDPNRVSNGENQVSDGSNQVSIGNNGVPPVTPHILTYTSAITHPHQAPNSPLTSSEDQPEETEEQNRQRQMKALEALMKKEANEALAA